MVSRNKGFLMGCQSGTGRLTQEQSPPLSCQPGLSADTWYQGSPSQHRHCPGNPRRHRNIERCSLCTWVCDLQLVGSDRARIQKQVVGDQSQLIQQNPTHNHSCSCLNEVWMSFHIFLSVYSTASLCPHRYSASVALFKSICGLMGCMNIGWKD